MAAILPGFRYDIFVSYRHNDNKYDGWVTEFVEKLGQELNATIKDKLSVYFDNNPTEGLHQTHDVDQSIQNNIKVLIFIPIISQTYCDTTSFAWKSEFKVFKNEASNDGMGLAIPVANGNIASRILPIRIHDIDIEDVRLLEDELSGSLRSIDFIYREAGVNRPLRAKDDEHTTAGGTLYRNQINKLANAVKEIVQGIKMSGKVTPPAPASTQNITARQIVPNTFSTSLPSSIKVQVIDRQRPAIYLAWTSADLKEQREEMAIVLQKAGFNVLPSTDCPADDAAFKERTMEEMKRCVCSLHILSGEFGRRFEFDEEISFPKFQFMEAQQRLQNDADFNTFVWMYPTTNQTVKPAQQEFVKYIRNNITRNMMFSNSAGPMQLVDDIRVITMKEEAAVYDSKDTDIFFIFNQQDEEEARIITDRLSLEYPVEIMNIMPDGEDQYRDISTQQIPKSKLAVVYFKYAADWALPFVKQIWKQVGGASSPTPLFLVGDDDPRSNLARSFKAPKVVTSIVPKDVIPSEVKKVYTSIVDLK